MSMLLKDYTITKTFSHNVLDMTKSKSTGKELVGKIIGAVERTQLFIIQELPDVLKVTKKQFKDIDENILKYSDREPRFFITKMNVMEIEVVDGKG